MGLSSGLGQAITISSIHSLDLACFHCPIFFSQTNFHLLQCNLIHLLKNVMSQFGFLFPNLFNPFSWSHSKQAFIPFKLIHLLDDLSQFWSSLLNLFNPFKHFSSLTTLSIYLKMSSQFGSFFPDLFNPFSETYHSKQTLIS